MLFRGSFRRWSDGAAVAMAALLVSPALLNGAAYDDGLELYSQGEYEKCVAAAEEALEGRRYIEQWSLLLARCQATLGNLPQAQTAVTNGLARRSSSIQLRLLGYEVFQANGLREQADGFLNEINELGSAYIWNYQDPDNLVTLGRAALLLGADPKLVLERFFDRARRDHPENMASYHASGELALAKNDYELAAKTYREALQQSASDPDLHYGLARAYAPSEREAALNSLTAALEINPRHTPSLVELTKHAIDAEDYPAAKDFLAKALAVNPAHPEALAYRAALALLEHDPTEAAASREAALGLWASNPIVDHIIGAQLSRKYRFEEGAEAQRRALAFDPTYMPARIQLAQDLLRLGDETEGWRLAGEVHSFDAYDVTAYNLVTLQEKIATFATLATGDFLVRMDEEEAALYGDRVLALLQEAREVLGAKYGVDPHRPTVVEIFPEEKDFGVRTFGMPDNPGYLGVCFGRVVTANSPASQAGDPHNWRAVLWHEFCHVITLQLTHNRMPRWLSEGISVYEERQVSPSWGQAMNPTYRGLILEDEFTPLSDLSGAFLTADSSLDLQFAYYQSYLAVEFLVEAYGFDCLLKVLHGLGEGVTINDAIAAQAAPIEEIDKAYAAFLRERAESLAPELDWEKPESEQLGGDLESLAKFLAERPNNFYALTLYARALLAAEQWERAEETARHLMSLYPEYVGDENPYRLAAEALRGAGRPEEERRVLEELAQRDADDLATYLRLIELTQQSGAVDETERYAEQVLAVNPLLPQPYRTLALVGEQKEQWARASEAWQRVLRFDPPDLAEVHYRTAQNLWRIADPAAKRHVLQALEEAPRHLAAHRLLLAMNRDEDGRAIPEAEAAPANPGSEAEAPVETEGEEVAPVATPNPVEAEGGLGPSEGGEQRR